MSLYQTQTHGEWIKHSCAGELRFAPGDPRLCFPLSLSTSELTCRDSISALPCPSFLLVLVKEIRGKRVWFPPWGLSLGWLCSGCCLLSLCAKSSGSSNFSTPLLLQGGGSPWGTTVLCFVDSLYPAHIFVNSPFTKLASNYPTLSIPSVC